MRRSCLLGLTLFLLLGLLAACGEAPDRRTPACRRRGLPTGRVAAVEGGAASGGQPGGAGERMSMWSPLGQCPVASPGPGTKAPSVRGTGFRWGMAALWRRPSPPGWGR